MQCFKFVSTTNKKRDAYEAKTKYIYLYIAESNYNKNFPNLLIECLLESEPI